MTAQAPDILIRRGRQFPLFSNPLEPFLETQSKRPTWMGSVISANWRGYVATWTIENRRLYLFRVGFDGSHHVGLRSLFPRAKDRVLADWFTGELRVPRGKLLEYVHLGYASHYERDLFISVEAGAVIGARVVTHTLEDAEGLAALQIAIKRERKEREPD